MQILKNNLSKNIKRIYTLILYCVVLSLGFILVACYDESHTKKLFYSIEDFTIHIEHASDELQNKFDYIHEFDYTAVLIARNLYNDFVRYGDGNRLIVWANQTLYNLSVISVGHDFINDELFFIPFGNFEKIDEVRPGEAFVIYNYRGMGGAFPWSGLTFTDGNGNRRYFFINQSLVTPYEFEGWRLWQIGEFYNRKDELPDGWEPWWP